MKGEMNKRGIADIIVTIVIVGLALAAIVVVWSVVSNLLNKQTGAVGDSGTCLGINIDATAMNCTLGSAVWTQNCSITLERTGSDTTPVGGVKFVFKNASAMTSPVLDMPGDVQKLAGKIVNINATITNANSVAMNAYLADSYLCPTNTYP